MKKEQEPKLNESGPEPEQKIEIGFEEPIISDEEHKKEVLLEIQKESRALAIQLKNAKTKEERDILEKKIADLAQDRERVLKQFEAKKGE